MRRLGYNGFVAIVIVVLTVVFALSCGKKNAVSGGNITDAVGGVSSGMDAGQPDAQTEDTRPPLPEEYVQEDIEEPRVTFDVKLEKLDPPTNLTASDGTYNDLVLVHWSNPIGGPATPDYTLIYRSESVSGTYEFLGGRTYPGANYFDSTAKPGKAYYYKARCSKQGYNPSDFSNTDTGFMSDRIYPPKNVEATDGTYTDKVKITWTHPGGAAPMIYYVYRSETAKDPNPSYIGSCFYPGRSFSDYDVGTGKKYYYKLKCYRESGKESEFSGEDSGFAAERLSPPLGVSASDGSFDDGIKISWTHPIQGQTPAAYYIYRSTVVNDLNPVFIGGRAYPATQFFDSTAERNTNYFYKVKSHKPGCFDSFFSVEDKGFYGDRLNPPENVSATDGDYMDKIRITWTPPTAGITPSVYYVYRSVAPDDPDPLYVGARSHPGTYYDDKTAVGDVAYYYKVRSHRNGCNDSYYSDEDAALRSSQWPMFGHDARHTGRSPYNGPETPTLKWTYNLDGYPTSPVIGTDGTVYIGDYGKFIAIDAEGALKWQYMPGGTDVTPAIGADETVYEGIRSTRDSYLYAFTPAGVRKWGCGLIGSLRGTAYTIGPEGAVYAACYSGCIYAYYTDCTLKWRLNDTTICSNSSPAVQNGGTVYVESGSWLCAVSSEGVIIWKYQTNGDYSSPAIGDDGTVYIGSTDGYLHALNADGTLKWSCPSGSGSRFATPAIGSDGTIYIGNYDKNLYAIGPEGSIKWRFPVDDSIESAPAIDADDTVYIGTYGHNLYAVNPDGSKKWEYQSAKQIFTSPAISADGVLYISCSKILCAFGDIQ